MSDIAVGALGLSMLSASCVWMAVVFVQWWRGK
jgi:hypothetical protein